MILELNHKSEELEAMKQQLTTAKIQIKQLTQASNSTIPATSTKTTDIQTLQTLQTTIQFSRKKIIVFHHHHKAGGTTLCTLARQNGHRTPPANCLVDNSLTKAACCGKSIQDQINFAKSTRFTFVANELFLPSELEHSNYNYVTIVRNPWDRYVSHYRMLEK